MLLILAIQIGSGVDPEQLRVSLEKADPVVDSCVAGDAALETAVDYVGDEAEPGRPVSFEVGLGGPVLPDHDGVT